LPNNAFTRDKRERRGSTYLFHLNSLNEDVILFVLVVVEEQTTVKHDGVMLLGDLISLGQVTVDVVLAIKFDLGQDTTAKSQRCLNCEIKAVFAQDWKHTGEAHVDQICQSVRLFATLHRFLSYTLQRENVNNLFLRFCRFCEKGEFCTYC